MPYAKLSAKPRQYTELVTPSIIYSGPSTSSLSNYDQQNIPVNPSNMDTSQNLTEVGT